MTITRRHFLSLLGAIPLLHLRPVQSEPKCQEPRYPLQGYPYRVNSSANLSPDYFGIQFSHDQ